MPRCAQCNTVVAAYTCERCNDGYYCSLACQRAHWPVHRNVCGGEDDSDTVSFAALSIGPRMDDELQSHRTKLNIVQLERKQAAQALEVEQNVLRAAIAQRSVIEQSAIATAEARLRAALVERDTAAKRVAEAEEAWQRARRAAVQRYSEAERAVASAQQHVAYVEQQKRERGAAAEYVPPPLSEQSAPLSAVDRAYTQRLNALLRRGEEQHTAEAEARAYAATKASKGGASKKRAKAPFNYEKTYQWAYTRLLRRQPEELARAMAKTLADAEAERARGGKVARTTAGPTPVFDYEQVYRDFYAAEKAQGESDVEAAARARSRAMATAELYKSQRTDDDDEDDEDDDDAEDLSSDDTHGNASHDEDEYDSEDDSDFEGGDDDDGDDDDADDDGDDEDPSAESASAQSADSSSSSMLTPKEERRALAAITADYAQRQAQDWADAVGYVPATSKPGAAFNIAAAVKLFGKGPGPAWVGDRLLATALWYQHYAQQTLDLDAKKLDWPELIDYGETADGVKLYLENQDGVLPRSYWRAITNDAPSEALVEWVSRDFVRLTRWKRALENSTYKDYAELLTAVYRAEGRAIKEQLNSMRETHAARLKLDIEKQMYDSSVAAGPSRDAARVIAERNIETERALERDLRSRKWLVLIAYRIWLRTHPATFSEVLEDPEIDLVL